jgi:hypothetical protein
MIRRQLQLLWFRHGRRPMIAHNRIQRHFKASREQHEIDHLRTEKKEQQWAPTTPAAVAV